MQRVDTEVPDVRLNVTSGISMPMVQGWVITDALEMRSPEGLVVGVTSYPARDGMDATMLAGQDAPEGFDSSGDPEAAQLFGGRESVIRRFQSTSGENRTQLAAYSMANRRAIVARATAPTEGFAAAEPQFLELMSQISIGGLESEADRTEEGSDPDNSGPAFFRFIKGANSLLELPEISESLDAQALGRVIESAGSVSEGEPAHVFYLSGAELHAVAHLYGQSSFPGVAPNPNGTAVGAAREATARSALLSRGMLTAITTDRIQLRTSVSDFAVRAFHAHLILETSVVNDGRLRRLIVFVSPTMASATIEHLPGEVYRCAVVSVEQAFGSLEELIVGDGEAESGFPPSIVVDSEGSPDADLGEPHSGGICEVTVVRGETVLTDKLEWIDFPGAGRYAHEADDRWVACRPDDLFTSIIAAITG